jgi:ribonuclease HI
VNTRQEIVAIYADGGLVRCNPSPYAGAWAWCHINAWGVIVARNSGIVPWTGIWMGVTNNEMEATALIEGLESLPEWWTGRVCSDSQVALGWVLARDGVGYQSKCPAALRQRAIRATQRLGHIRRVLMNGHPSQKDLARGFGSRGLPCDSYQVVCDTECSRLTEEYIRAHNIPKATQKAVQRESGASL